MASECWASVLFDQSHPYPYEISGLWLIIKQAEILLQDCTDASADQWRTKDQFSHVTAYFMSAVKSTKSRNIDTYITSILEYPEKPIHSQIGLAPMSRARLQPTGVGDLYL